MTPNLWIFSLLPPHQHSRLVAHFLTCVKFDVFGANNHYKHCSSNNNRGVECEFPHTCILTMKNSYHSIFSHLLTFWNSQSQWKYGSESSPGGKKRLFSDYLLSFRYGAAKLIRNLIYWIRTSTGSTK